MKDRFKAFCIHFAISLCIATLASCLIFGIWYPYPYREISGGRELVSLLIAVDVIIGPLITLAIFNTAKPSSELKRDVAVVGILQITALTYGLWTVASARPVGLVFEIDRFRVIHAADVTDEFLQHAPPDLVSMGWMGPKLMAVRPFHSASEEMEATLAALQGVELASRPDLWQNYDVAKPRVLHAAKAVVLLRNRFPQRASEIDQVLKSTGRTAERLLYLPVVGRKSFWTAFLDPTTADVVEFMPLDSF